MQWQRILIIIWEANMKTLWIRFKSDINKFWKGVRNFAIWLTGIATAIIAANATITGICLPEILITVCSYIIVGGIVLGITAQTTTK
jgi:hypothetical protein